MALALTLARFFPTEDSYAPFGLGWLRGFNVLPIALLFLLGLLWAVQRGALGLLARSLAWPVLLLEVSSVVFIALLFVPMIMGIVAALNLAERRGLVANALCLSVAVLAGTALIALLQSPLECLYLDEVDMRGLGCSVASWSWYQVSAAIHGGLWGAAFAALLYAHRRRLTAARDMREAQLRRLHAERQEAEARLHSLQAQIEPHFLFNTLAHVQRLHEVDPRQGHSMLASLIEYMRSALPQMREQESTLGRELALVNAYVRVQQIRMGDRLQVETAVPDGLLDVRVPPMMVLTLAENAIKHGLGPRRRGGLLRVAARRGHDATIEIEVLDDGVGLSPGSGGGRGLANTRARLRTLYGDSGLLQISNRPDGGVRAALVFPS